MTTKMLQSANPMAHFDQMPTLGDIARYYARARPAAVAMTFEGRETTFAEFDHHSNQVAHALAAEVVKKGERVAYVGKNSDLYFEIAFGAAKAGVVLIPIGWRLSPTEISVILNDCRSSIVFVGPEVMAQVEQSLIGVRPRPKVIAMEPISSLHCTLYEPWRDAASSSDVTIAVEESDVALQLYTSGTTGKPKGVMLTNANLLSGRQAAAKAQMPWNIWGADDVSLVAMPVAHVGGSVWGIIGLYNGAKAVIAREFNPLNVLDLKRYPFCGRHELAFKSYPRPVGGSPATTTTPAGGG